MIDWLIRGNIKYIVHLCENNLQQTLMYYNKGEKYNIFDT